MNEYEYVNYMRLVELRVRLERVALKREFLRKARRMLRARRVKGAA